MTNLNNTGMNTSRVRAIVMRRVHTIHFLQSPVTTVVFAGILFILTAWGIGREVWVAHVLHNMPSLTDWDAVLRFYLAAFMDTRFIVQALSIVALGAFVWLVVNIIRLASQSIQFA
jgi:hypothetical protein